MTRGLSVSHPYLTRTEEELHIHAGREADPPVFDIYPSTLLPPQLFHALDEELAEASSHLS
jgi:hypothetical protein